MNKICMYDTKPYDKAFFDEINKNVYNNKFDITYYESKLVKKSAVLAKDFDVAIAFVNDKIDKETIDILYSLNVGLLAMRCSGYNNVDIKYAKGKIKVVRVPAYSPYAVAEYTMGMLLTLNRKIHRAYNRVREYNFSLNGLIGFDLKGKTIGIVGTGKIGKVFINVCKGFEMNILAYDAYPDTNSDIKYVEFDELCKQSDIISLHCPLTKGTKHIINENSIKSMKDGVIILNTSRGALIDSEALLQAIKDKKIGGAALDVYEEESDLFYEDNSDTIIQDDIIARLISMPNVFLSSHQAFLTKEALLNIASTTLENIEKYFKGEENENEIK